MGISINARGNGESEKNGLWSVRLSREMQIFSSSSPSLLPRVEGCLLRGWMVVIFRSYSFSLSPSFLKSIAIFVYGYSFLGKRRRRRGRRRPNQHPLLRLPADD